MITRDAQFGNEVMDSIEELRAAVLSGERDWKQYGDVNANYGKDCVIFNYSAAAQYAGRWNWFERVSRGLIIDCKTGEVVARPFDKFFNWGERGRKGTGHIVNVTEKYDGSLGILYRRGSHHLIATRGAFDSDQALWATDYLRAHYKLGDLPDNLTLLFEIIYSDNRIVVDYGDFEGLILLAARDRYTGDYLPFYPDLFELARQFNLHLVDGVSFNSIRDIIAATDDLDANREGWVVEMSDGSRWKFKGDRYLELHKLLHQTSYKQVVQAMAAGRSLRTLLEGTPDDFQAQILEWEAEIQARVRTVVDRVAVAWENAPRARTRKDFALWVQEYHPDLSTYLFAKLDGKEVLPIIYRQEFKKGGDRA